MYRAYISRASGGEIDNTPIIDKVLALRQEKSQLLGFKSYAELSMASKVREDGGGGLRRWHLVHRMHETRSRR